MFGDGDIINATDRRSGGNEAVDAIEIARRSRLETGTCMHRRVRDEGVENVTDRLPTPS